MIRTVVVVVVAVVVVLHNTPTSSINTHNTNDNNNEVNTYGNINGINTNNNNAVNTNGNINDINTNPQNNDTIDINININDNANKNGNTDGSTNAINTNVNSSNTINTNDNRNTINTNNNDSNNINTNDRGHNNYDESDTAWLTEMKVSDMNVKKVFALQSVDASPAEALSLPTTTALGLPTTTNTDDLVTVTRLLLEEYHSSCGLFVIIDGQHLDFVHLLFLMLGQQLIPFTVMDLRYNTFANGVPGGSGRSGCEVLVYVAEYKTNLTLLMGPTYNFGWRTQDLRLMFVAPRSDVTTHWMKPLLLHRSLDESIDVVAISQRKGRTFVEIHHRCLYCGAPGPGLGSGGNEEGTPEDRRRGRALVKLVDKWTPERGFAEHANIFPDQLSNMQGAEIRIVTLAFPPFSNYKTVASGSGEVVVPKDSIDARICTAAASVLNFSFNLTKPEDGKWGQLSDNGTWSGIFQMILQKKGDWSGILSITSQRVSWFDMTRAYYFEPMTFIMKKPGPLPQWQALYRPFSPVVWVVTFVVISVSGSVLWLIVELSKWVTNDDQPWEQAHRSFQILNLSMFGSVFQEPAELSPRFHCSRVFLAFWWLFCLLLSTMYSSSLTAHLTIPSINPALNTLQALANSQLDWGMLNSYGSGYELFKSSTVPEYRKLFSRMEYIPQSKLLDRVADGNFGLVSWRAYMRNLEALKKHEPDWNTQIHYAREDFFPSGFGWAFRKGSRFARKLDWIILQLMEGGFIDKWLTELIENTAKAAPASAETAGDSDQQKHKVKQEEEEGALKPFTLDNLQGPFMALCGGWALALVVFMAELIIARKKHRQL